MIRKNLLLRISSFSGRNLRNEAAILKQEFSNYEFLTLYDLNITNIDFLHYFPNLIKLSLSNNDIERIEGLENLSKLERLSLSHNQIKKIEGLDRLVKLEHLYLDSNKINEISGLENLNNLEVLHLHNNEITDLNGLNKLENLKILTIYNNYLNKLNGLNGLKNLERIYLFEIDNNNNIKSQREFNYLRHKKFIINNTIKHIKGECEIVNYFQDSFLNNMIKLELEKRDDVENINEGEIDIIIEKYKKVLKLIK